MYYKIRKQRIYITFKFVFIKYFAYSTNHIPIKFHLPQLFHNFTTSSFILLQDKYLNENLYLLLLKAFSEAEFNYYVKISQIDALLNLLTTIKLKLFFIKYFNFSANHNLSFFLFSMLFYNFISHPYILPRNKYIDEILHLLQISFFIIISNIEREINPANPVTKSTSSKFIRILYSHLRVLFFYFRKF